MYIDDGSGGYDIRENIFCRIKSADPDATNAGIAAIYYHGGHDNTAYKNVFIDCAVGVAHSPWEDEWWLKNINCAAWRHNLKDEVDIESDIYQKKYPQLKNFFKNDRPRVNYLTQNLYFRTSGPLNGNFVYKWNAFLNPSKSVPCDKELDTRGCARILRRQRGCPLNSFAAHRRKLVCGKLYTGNPDDYQRRKENLHRICCLRE